MAQGVRYPDAALSPRGETSYLAGAVWTRATASPITSPAEQEGARRGLDREEDSRETQVYEVYEDQLKEKLRSGPGRTWCRVGLSTPGRVTSSGSTTWASI
jgi:hypothetical protein